MNGRSLHSWVLNLDSGPYLGTQLRYRSPFNLADNLNCCKVSVLAQLVSSLGSDKLVEEYTALDEYTTLGCNDWLNNLLLNPLVDIDWTNEVTGHTRGSSITSSKGSLGEDATHLLILLLLLSNWIDATEWACFLLFDFVVRFLGLSVDSAPQILHQVHSLCPVGALEISAR